jgi:hypothetical protein
MAADRPYGEFYEFYSVSPEYFAYTLVIYIAVLLVPGSAHLHVLFTLQQRKFII